MRDDYVAVGDMVVSPTGVRGEVVAVTDEIVAIQTGIVRSEMNHDKFEAMYGAQVR